jgi:hypothetical protein
MQNQEIGLSVTSDLERNWSGAARWARFISIVYFVLLGLGVFVMLAALLFLERGSDDLDALDTANPFSPFSMFGTGFWIGLGTLYILGFGFAILVTFQHLKFASGLDAAMRGADQLQFEEAWGRLATCFRWWGYATIAYIVLYLAFSVYMGTLAQQMMPTIGE